MRIQTIFTMFVFATLFANCQSDAKFKRVDNSEVDSTKLAFATTISKNLLTAQNEGSFYTLSNNEATEEMVSSLNQSVQKKSFEQIQSAFGNYQDLSFDHLMKSTEGTLYEIYRFKGKFSPEAEVEVRAVLDANGKLAGFFVKPWKETL